MLIPYAKVNGEWNIPDHLMMGMYTKLKAQNLHKTVFYDGSVNSEHEFLLVMQNTENLPIIAFDEVPIGMGWINGISFKYALCHHFFFKEFWGKKTVEGAKSFIDYWFSMKDDKGYIFNTLLGMTPSNNKLAVRFLDKINFHKVGEIPHIGVISYTERSEWAANPANPTSEQQERQPVSSS